MDASSSTDHRIVAVADRLSKELVDEHGAPADPEQVKAAVEAAGAELADAPVQEFVPLLVEHEARQELRQQGLRRVLPEVDNAPARQDDLQQPSGPALSTQQGIPPR